MIVLLTDFGQSEYVGVMKGVIYSIDPDAKIVDLCHDISPQSIIEASWILKNNYKYFPKGAVFCCVVDPGVGTQRKALAVKTENFYFVAPDNGLLWEALYEQKVLDIRQIPIPAEASRTFHGRDVFAKTAANINQGKFDTIGERTDPLPPHSCLRQEDVGGDAGAWKIEKLELYLDGRAGIVVRIDRFGNIITNLDSATRTADKCRQTSLAKQDKDEFAVAIDGKKYNMQYYPDYDSAKEGELFLIEGSNNTLEISLKNTSANEKLRIKTGQRIIIS